MKILVIGAGLTGLSCAQELHSQGHEITIVESRAEIGHSQDKPGLVSGEVDLSEHAPQIYLTESGCRRGWLAKSMAQNLPVTYLLRTQSSLSGNGLKVLIRPPLGTPCAYPRVARSDSNQPSTEAIE